MKNKRQYLKIFLLIAVVGIAFGFFVKAGAQVDVVTYLIEEFKLQSVPVKQVVVLEENPLKIQVVAVSFQNEGITFEDHLTLNSVDRIVALSAREKGYSIQSYRTIIQDNKGNQLFGEERIIDVEQINSVLNRIQTNISDNSVNTLAIREVEMLLSDYKLENVSAQVDVTSLNGSRYLYIQLSLPSMDNAEKAATLLWVFHHTKYFRELEENGSQIAVYRAKLLDEKGVTLMDYLYDYEINSGSWVQDERIPPLGGSPGADPAASP
ncbi:MAG TPA: hypothetical protein PKE48_11810 [Anaerolineales bacterium]|nr:hypothetical protein [Anaerolineales bacterium]HNC90285.1 hypothetical protein [Anaerolineales bacterium]HND49241.1 hypothetical protein [Anaerolineales bacterium]HNE04838.1 hypothetical protein [Anaerolineales bacterium]